MGKIDFQALADFQNNLENIGSLYRYQKIYPQNLMLESFPTGGYAILLHKRGCILDKR